MQAKEIEARLLAHYGIRVEPEMSAYVARQLAHAGRALGQLPVIGGEAKTGLPRRIVVDANVLRQPPAQ